MAANLLFHLAIPTDNLAAAQKFYRDGLGCQVGRQSAHATIFNFYGHQLVVHATNEPLNRQKGIYPRHFGLIFANLSDWQNLVDRATAQALKIYQSPRRRFFGQLIEHHTFFLQDPSLNILEFKHYVHGEAVFGGHSVEAIGDRAG